MIAAKALCQQDRAGFSLRNSERDIELSNLQCEWVGLCRPGPESGPERLLEIISV